MMQLEQQELYDAAHRSKVRRCEPVWVALPFCVAALAISLVAIIRVQNLSATAAATPATPMMQRAISFRLLPGEELLSGIMKRVNDHRLQSAWLVTTVGSLTHYEIRYANQPTGTPGDGHFEIVSLVGTMTCNGTGRVGVTASGAWHIHIALGDGNGSTVSGHMQPGNIIYTTAEIVIGYSCAFSYYRADDGTTGYDELQIVNTPWC